MISIRDPGTSRSALSRNFYLIQDGEQTQLYPESRIPDGDEEKVSSGIFQVEIPNNPCPLVEVISEGFTNVTSGYFQI